MKIRFFNRTLHQKKTAIWRGIIQKAQADGDHSLDQMDDSRLPVIIRYKNYVAAAAVLIVFLLSTLMLFNTIQSSKETLSEKELSGIFADTSSISRLVRSNGDTIFLDNMAKIPSFIEAKNGRVMLEFNSDSLKKGDYGMNIVESGRGKQLHIVLPDGTKVWLNASSKIEFPSQFEDKIREVRVFGEAYFEVVSNRKKPFIVNFSNEKVEVLGTHFNIRDYTNESKNLVTLLEGSVAVTNINNPDFSTILKPADQISIYRTGHKSEVKTLSNPNSVLAWKEGEFYFDNADAEDIVKELERWYPVNITIISKNSTNKISGRIKRSDSLKKVVDMLHFFEIELLIEKQL